MDGGATRRRRCYPTLRRPAVRSHARSVRGEERALTHCSNTALPRLGHFGVANGAVFRRDCSDNATLGTPDTGTGPAFWNTLESEPAPCTGRTRADEVVLLLGGSRMSAYYTRILRSTVNTFRGNTP